MSVDSEPAYGDVYSDHGPRPVGFERGPHMNAEGARPTPATDKIGSAPNPDTSTSEPLPTSAG